MASALGPLDGDKGGADGVEFDVRLTCDGIPVVFHDDDTAALTGEPGTIESRSLSQVQNLRVRGESIPTLEAVIDAVMALHLSPSPFGINVELKPAADPLPLIKACMPLLRPMTRGTTPSLVVSSFDPKVLKCAMDVGVAWRLAYLYDTPHALTALRFLEGRGALDLHPHHSLVESSEIDRILAPGRQIRVWTVDDPADALRVSGVHASITAIITNRPALIRRALRTTGSTNPNSQDVT